MSLAHKLRRFVHLATSEEPRDKIQMYQRLAAVPVLGVSMKRLEQFIAMITQRDKDSYCERMQQIYQSYAAADKVTAGNIDGDFVVGSWRAHNEWTDYEEFLMRYVPQEPSWVALEYGCGPGRNILRWSSRFARIDGVDLSQINLDHARVFVAGLPPQKAPRLFLTTGIDCADAPKEHYDFAFSTICFQHICVHEVRSSILRSIFECLKPGGRLSAQMGFGSPSPLTVPYFSNYYQAIGTNRACDTEMANAGQIEGDLLKIGFDRFEHWIRPPGPGDCHPNWIFFTAVKPTYQSPASSAALT